MQLSDNLKSALYMGIGMAGFAANDALLKYGFDELGLYQSIFIRGVFSTLLLATWAYYKGAFSEVAQSLNGLVLLRVTGEVGGTICFLSALISISLADASAILQAVPLVVTVAAIVFLGERVGPKRIVATLVGFVGVLIIIKPGGDDFNIYYLVALAAVGFIVLRDISTRKLTSDVSTELVAFLTALGVMLLGLVGSFFEEWSGVSIGQYSNLFFASVALLVGYLFTVLAFRQGDVGFVAPFIYTYLVWAIILSIVMFAEYPDQYTTVGSIIVVVTGLYSFWIEQKETGTVAI